MRKRTRFIAVTVLAVAAFVLVGYVWYWNSADHARERFDQIENGMTRTDVLAVMGEPDVSELEGVVLHWYGDRGHGWVAFNDNTVVGKQWVTPPHERTLSQRFRTWLLATFGI